MQTDNKNDINQVNEHLAANGNDWDKIYLDNFPALYNYAFTIVNNATLAEEMIHQVFLKILERNEPVTIHTSLKAYMYRSVHNECLNHLKHQKVKQAWQADAVNNMKAPTENSSGKLQYQELEQRLRKAINELPEQCRTIFQLSRFEELRYTEIATQLGLSVKTVENQMSKALKRLRIRLADFLPLIFWILFNMLS